MHHLPVGKRIASLNITYRSLIPVCEIARSFLSFTLFCFCFFNGRTIIQSILIWSHGVGPFFILLAHPGSIYWVPCLKKKILGAIAGHRLLKLQLLILPGQRSTFLSNKPGITDVALATWQKNSQPQHYIQITHPCV